MQSLGQGQLFVIWDGVNMSLFYKSKMKAFLDNKTLHVLEDWFCFGRTETLWEKDKMLVFQYFPLFLMFSKPSPFLLNPLTINLLKTMWKKEKIHNVSSLSIHIFHQLLHIQFSSANSFFFDKSRITGTSSRIGLN